MKKDSVEFDDDTVEVILKNEQIVEILMEGLELSLGELVDDNDGANEGEGYEADADVNDHLPPSV